MSQQDSALVQLEGQLASLSRRRFLKTGLVLGTTAATVLTCLAVLLLKVYPLIFVILAKLNIAYLISYVKSF
jgi:hypothetical protein